MRTVHSSIRVGITSEEENGRRGRRTVHLSTRVGITSEEASPNPLPPCRLPPNRNMELRKPENRRDRDDDWHYSYVRLVCKYRLC
jgi:hypothetical protein